MIRASDEFKAMLGMAERSTKSILMSDNLSDLQKAYYGDVWELLHRLGCMIMREGDSDYIELKTEDEMIAEMKKENKDLMENPETVAKFLIELKDEYAGYPVSICDMDGNEEMHFLLLQETDFEYLASIGYKKVLDSKIFAWKIYDDDGEEEIYIEIEE